jgi:alpha-L-fucosidase 2
VVAVCIGGQAEGASSLAAARICVEEALKGGYAPSFKRHAKWWAGFWQQSSAQFPEPEILRHYYLVRYFYGAASRLGAPPMPLQGVWTADDGSLPPWKGDYHNDLNTQMTYMGYQGAGHFDEGRCFLDLNWRLLPTYRKFAREFYGTPGANVPGVMSLAGDPLTGWGQYALSPAMGPWIAHLFYLHWRFTADDRFLRTRAYPWCRALGQSLQALLRPDAQGVLTLPLSTSPEIHGNSPSSWLTPNSNYDLFSLKMMFLALREMADACGETGEARQWAKVATALGPAHENAKGALLLDPRQELRESHRHLSNLIGIYPFNLVTVDGGDTDRRTIRASLEQWDKLGTSGWCGYSYSWMAALRARVGDAETAVRDLDIFVKAFTLRNGFHVNGDQTHSGFSDFTGRPFTLEGNMLAAAAVHEMLLQSWSPTPGVRDSEVLRLFPATPARWHHASYESLRAEGGHQVSARRENNVTTWFRIVAGKDGPLRIRDNFGERNPQWNRRGIGKERNDFVVNVRRGEVIEARLPATAQVPPAPAGAAEPPTRP